MPLRPERIAAVALVPLAAVLALTPANAQHPAHRAATRHAAAPSDDAAIHNVFWQPNELHQGSPIFFTVELERPARRVSGTFLNKPLTFLAEKTDGKVWHALGGAGLDTQPGSYNVEITAALASGRSAHISKPLTIAPGDFKTGDINVPENYVNPNETEQKQIAADEAMKKRAYDRRTPRILWSGDFAKPVSAAPTPTFGESRILNEERTSLHTGTDYPTREGTPVSASNSGIVVLTRDLFYEGNTVILDHGQGLFTVYLHLSRIDVKEGDHVDKGQRIGLSGASGRVTGPHVHFGVRNNGEWLDPVQLLSLTLPKTEAVQETTFRPVERRSPHPRRR